MFHNSVVKKIKTHIFCSITFFKKHAAMKYCGKILYSQTGHRWQHGSRILHAGYLNLKTHTQNMYTYCFFHCNNGCTNAPQCHVICTLSVLFHINTQNSTNWTSLFSFSQMILFHSIMLEFVKSVKFPNCMYTYTHK